MSERVKPAELRPVIYRARSRYLTAFDEALRQHAYMVRMEIALELALKRIADEYREEILDRVARQWDTQQIADWLFSAIDIDAVSAREIVQKVAGRMPT